MYCPILVQRGLLGQVFTINGVNYPTDDGTVIRDYIMLVQMLLEPLLLQHIG